MIFPSEKGTYILILRLRAHSRLTIGRLGSFDFPGGWYAYVGSAFGSGGLRGRLKHHLAPVTKPHWHIDYLRAAAPVREVWWNTGDIRLEHMWAQLLHPLPGADILVPRFGASDCNCPSHLVFFSAKPSFPIFAVSTNAFLHATRIDE